MTLGRRSALLFAATLAVAAYAFLGERERAAAKPGPSRFKPFTLTEQELYFSKGDAVPKEVDHVVARRADGSLVRSFVVTGSDSPDGTEGTHVMILNVPSRLQITLESFTRSSMTRKLSKEKLDSRLSDEPFCDGLAKAARRKAGADSQTVLGYRVFPVREKNRDWISEKWVAPVLDCYPLKETVQFLDSSGQEDGHNLTMVKTVKEGEPSSELFLVPGDYTERSPAEVEKIYASKYPGHELYGKMLPNIERSYDESRDH
jgi:hypothetical protein